MFPEDFPKSFSSAASRESTRPELFCKNSQTSQENNCARVSLGLQLYSKREPGTGVVL